MFNVYMISAKHLTYLSLIEILEITFWGLQINEVVENQRPINQINLWGQV